MLPACRQAGIQLSFITKYFNEFAYEFCGANILFFTNTMSASPVLFHFIVNCYIFVKINLDFQVGQHAIRSGFVASFVNFFN